MQTAKLSARECRLRIADVQRKITLAQEAKRKVQFKVRELNEQYVRGLISYETFNARMNTFLKQRSLDDWLKYYDECIVTYREHSAHYAKILARGEEHSVNICYLGIFLILAVTLGIFLFAPFLQLEGFFPTGEVTSGVFLNQSVYTTNAKIDGLRTGTSNVTITLYRTPTTLDFIPHNTTVNVTLRNITGQIINESMMHFNQFIFNSTTPKCLNFTEEPGFIYDDLNNTWELETSLGAGYGHNATIGAGTTVGGCTIGAVTQPNNFTVNLSRFFPTGLSVPSIVGFYNLTINVTINGTVQQITSFMKSFIVDDRAPQWNETRINNSISFSNTMGVQFNTTWNDDLNLEGFIFSINQGSAYVNSTYISFGLNSFDKEYNLSTNVTLVNVSRGGTNVTWFYFANDSAGRSNITALQWVVVNTPPSLSAVNITPLTHDGLNISANVFGASDYDMDSVNITYNWFDNNKSIAVLNMPMTNAFYGFMNDKAISPLGGNLTFDFSSYDNHGTVYNGRFNRTGKLGGAYWFNGVLGNISILNSPSLNVTNVTGNLTLEAWVWADSVGSAGTNNNTIVSKKNNSDGYILRLMGGIPQLAVGPDNSSAVGVHKVLVGSWYHLVGVWNGTSCMIYVNGSLYGGSTSCVSLPASIIGVGVGTSITSNVWSGMIDDVKIYNRSLSPEQIGANYYGGLGMYNLTVQQELRAGEKWNVSATPIDDDGLNGSTVMNFNTSITITESPDLVAPFVRLLSPINATNTSLSTIWFNFSFSDDRGATNATLWGDWPSGGGAEYIFKVNNTNTTALVNGFTLGAIVLVNNSINVTNIPEGNWTWNVQVCDRGSNCPFNTTNFTITVDRTGPNVTLIQPLNNSINRTNTFIDLFYNVTDLVSLNILNCTAVINNTQSFTAYGPTKGTRNNISTELVNGGDYNWTVGCFDQAGNNWNSSYFNFSIRLNIVSCTVSTESFNISFGDNVAQNTKNNASDNWRGYANVDGGINNFSRYNISSSGSTVPVNITIKGDHLVILPTTPGGYIGIGNVSWNSTTVQKLAANDSMVFPGKKNISTDFLEGEAGGDVAQDLVAGGTAWLRFWLNVPTGSYAGKYLGNYTIQCVDAT